jgi:zinc protease
MNEGTEALDTLAFSDKLDGLGATLNVGSDDEGITISLRTLRKHLSEAAVLFRDVVLRPRLGQSDFDRLKTQRLTALQSRGDSIRTISANAWARVVYGKDSLQGWPAAGTVDSVTALTLAQVKDFWRQHVVPRGARLQVVGDIDAKGVHDLLAELADNWSGNEPAPIVEAAPPMPKGLHVYLVDKPGAPQSSLHIGHPSVASTDPEWYPLTVMNYPLGGAFSGRINMNLREAKGYTYGARSAFNGGLTSGLFEASAEVKTEVTKESVVETLKELNGMEQGLKDDEVSFARDSLTQAMSRSYESINALGGLLDNVARYNWPDDYPARRLKYLSTVSREQLDSLAQRYLHPDTLHILVVGDAAKVRDGLKSLGYPMTELDIDGNPLPQG